MTLPVRGSWPRNAGPMAAGTTHAPEQAGNCAETLHMGMRRMPSADVGDGWTAMHRSKVGLRKWFELIRMMTSYSNGVSAERAHWAANSVADAGPRGSLGCSHFSAATIFAHAQALSHTTGALTTDSLRLSGIIVSRNGNWRSFIQRERLVLLS